jgi:hypothetical protein
MLGMSVALPRAALGRSELDKDLQKAPDSIVDWLESLKPGWSVRFAPAFKCAGITELKKVAELEEAANDLLMDELRRHGVGLVQLKQLKQAIERLNFTGAMPLASPHCATPKVTPTCKSPPVLLGHRLSTCKSPASRFFDGDDDVKSKITDESGLPCKSPMSAFFDGDNLFEDFFTSPSVESSCTSWPPTRQMIGSSVSDVSCSGSTLPSPSFNIMPSAPPGILRKGPSKCNRVSFADGDGRASLQLSELIHVPSLAAQHVWQQSKDPKGTFEVQSAIDECSSDNERIELAAELRGHVFEATQCPHANHVLRKFITCLPAHAMDFIVLELLDNGKAGVVQIAQHKYGCRILEGLLGCCSLSQLSCMIEFVVAEASSLCTHMYGNFVIQSLLEQPCLDKAGRLTECIRANLVTIGTSFYGSAVLRKALLCRSDSERCMLARAIISVNGLLAAIGRFRHGKESVNLILATLQGFDKNLALNQCSMAPLKLPKHTRSR